MYRKELLGQVQLRAVYYARVSTEEEKQVNALAKHLLSTPVWVVNLLRKFSTVFFCKNRFDTSNKWIVWFISKQTIKGKVGKSRWEQSYRSEDRV